MLLSNQKYLAVEYEFSSEFSDYLVSITSFVYNLISTYNDANLEGSRFSDITVPDEIDELIYYEEDNRELFSYIQFFINEELLKQLKFNKNVIFVFNNIIIFNENKKSLLRELQPNECTTRTVFDTTFNKISYSVNSSNVLKKKILEFWYNKIDCLTYKILEKYIDEKVSVSKILISGKNYHTDFLPLERSTFIDCKLIFDADKQIELDSKIVDRFYEKTGINLNEDTLYTDCVQLENDTIKEIGIYIDNKIYLHNFYGNKSNLNISQKILFDYFKFSIKIDFEKKSDAIMDFSSIRSKNKDTKLTEVLSSLENNLYLKKTKFDELDSEIQDFFQTSYLVQNKEFKNFHFFIFKEDTDNEFLLGVFNNSNEQLHDGSRVKGLKCWIDKNSKEIKSFENYEHIKNASQLVCHLSPEYAFYFKEKFFEDYLEDILDEIKSDEQDLNLEYITNNKFYFSKECTIDSPLEKKYQKGKIEQEFDFIVSIEKDGISKNVVLEAKTKLSKYIADEQREKVQKYIKHDKLKIFDEYVLIGFNYDNTMKSLQYFQNKYPIKSCQDKIDIAFNYPLPATDDKNLYCMSSTSYENLKQSLISLFRAEIYE